jgi:CRP/FNR family transcriptional regulator, anaerobic regulatory protein
MPHGEGPSLRAVPFSQTGDGLAAKLLTPRQRQQLASLSTKVTFAPRATVYHEHSLTTAVYICAEGSLKAFRELPSGRRRITAFLFADDLFGLAERGRYVNTVQSLTQSVCYRIPIEPLQAILRSDAELGFHFLCKMVHEMRALQLQSIVMGHRSARGRIAMFLTMLERNMRAHSMEGGMPLPMSRSDIAGYLGLSLEAVSRAGKQLVDAGVVDFSPDRVVRVVDRKKLEKLARDV